MKPKNGKNLLLKLHIIPEHVLTDMKSPKGLGIEISF